MSLLKFQMRVRIPFGADVRCNPPAVSSLYFLLTIISYPFHSLLYITCIVSSGDTHGFSVSFFYCSDTARGPVMFMRKFDDLVTLIQKLSFARTRKLCLCCSAQSLNMSVCVLSVVFRFSFVPNKITCYLNVNHNCLNLVSAIQIFKFEF